MSQGSQVGFSRTFPSLETLQSLYDGNLFQQAYALISGYWNNSTKIDDLSAAEMVLALRLAARLGGFRLSRRLARTAKTRFPEDPLVRYYTVHLSREKQVFDDFRALEAQPELSGADVETQSSWLAYSAVRWATIRDFEHAHQCIEKAKALRARDSWVLSCESDVLGMEDRWDEALEAAERAWEFGPGTPYAARSLTSSLLNLRRVGEAAERLAEAAKTGESYELPLLAAWYLCAKAETLSGDERKQTILRAAEFAKQMAGLAPLADREMKALFARTWLDIAEMMDDHEGMARWAEEARSPFHRQVLQNLRKNPSGERIRLPFRHAIQKHNECLPTSIGSAMQAMGLQVDVDAMAAAITFGGTPEWAAGEWLENHGFVVRYFAVNPEVSVKLIKNGFAFVLTLENDSNAHAVAAVGMDEAAGTLLIHDPQGFRATEYLLEALGKNETPLGPRAMVATSPEKAPLLEQLLPVDDVAALTAKAMYLRAVSTHGAASARAVVDELTMQLPHHPVARMLRAEEMHRDGHAGAALSEFQKLMEEFPASAVVRSSLLSCCRSLGNTAMMRDVLANVVERGQVPGIESQQAWQFPPSTYVVEYADLLRSSNETRRQGSSLLHSLLRRYVSCGPAWHVIGDLLWNDRDREGALLGYRIGAYLQDRSEHYAQAYCDALCQMGREHDGLAWLERRVRKFGSSLHGVATWVTWIYSLEVWGHPERALKSAKDALDRHGNAAELLAPLVALFARMGRWSEAEALLARLERTKNSTLFNEAALSFYRMRGELTKAIEHGETWLDESPLWMRARHQLIDVLARRDGTDAVIQRARAWLREYPGHDEMEQLYCGQLDRNGYTSRQKYSILLRRVKRNAQDGWAWRELAFSTIYAFERADVRLQGRLKRRILHFLAQCDRTSPGESVTRRAHAEWAEARCEWPEAAELWTLCVEQDPTNLYSYNRAWDCSARLSSAERVAVCKRIESALLREQGRSSVAGDVSNLVENRFGVTMAEEMVTAWKQERPDDPKVVEAHVDLLLQHGHGRTDYERALAMLLPELERFPFQVGLRISHADALRKLRRFSEAEQVLVEIVRRHPDNSSVQIQLAWVNHGHGRTDDALHELEISAARDPQNVNLLRAKVEILLEARRFQEANQILRHVSQEFPKSISWRESAILLLLQCEDVEGAVQTAREGVIQHPRGAYLWLLLGRTLFNQRRYASQGEIEACFRRSLALNQGLFQAADYLSMLLTEQRRYAEAEEVVLKAGTRMGDDSPARARVAWTLRKKGQPRDAVKEMTAVVQHAPWSGWGWTVLMGWLTEDKEWGTARELLRTVPPEIRTNTQLRYRRLELLEKAQLSPNALDEEWKSLLHDFPEDLSSHAIRYDSLVGSDRNAEAADVLEHIRAFHPGNPYILGRWVEVLLKQGKRDEGIAALISLLFAQTEPSNWPVDYGWQAVRKAGLAAIAYDKARDQFAHGWRPTRRAVFLLAAYAMETNEKKLGTQPLWRALFPGDGAKALLKMLNHADGIIASPGAHRAVLLSQLSDFGYTRLVIRYWKKHKREIEADIESWSEVARAFTALHRRGQARKFLAGWRQRVGVSMWVVANYVIASNGSSKRQLLDVRSACRDALAGLPHDHCARFLAYMEAESCALLGDKQAFLETWKRNKEYLDGQLNQGEYFDSKRKYLMADLPELERYLRNNQRWNYRQTLWRLRRSRLGLQFGEPAKRWVRKIRLRRWWWIIWVLIVLARLINQQ